MTKLTHFTSRLGFYLYFKLRIMQGWSRLYRKLFQGRARAVALPAVSYFNDLTTLVKQAKWKADGLKELGDAIPTGRMAYYRFLTDPKHYIGDCGAYAALIFDSISQALRTSKWEDDPVAPFLVAVNWAKADGKLGAHYVCAFARMDGEEAYSYGYMDYGTPYWFKSMNDLIEAIRNRYAKTDHIDLGYAIINGDTLKPEVISWS